MSISTPAHIDILKNRRIRRGELSCQGKCLSPISRGARFYGLARVCLMPALLTAVKCIEWRTAYMVRYHFRSQREAYMEAFDVIDHPVKDDWFPSGKELSRKVLRRVVPLLRRAVSAETSPSVTEIARTSRSPFQVLVSTVISARTKDEVTTEASHRLFARAASPADIASMTERSIEKLIFPAGFYRTKARAIRALARKIDRDFGGRVPDTIEGLLTLPGVGRKTANLVVTHGFGKPGICVDTHVHRFVNRLGAVRTMHPRETEFALRAVLPRRFWIEINELLVTYGKNICTPVSPFCSRCAVSKLCARSGVGRSR